MYKSVNQYISRFNKCKAN